MSETTLKKEFKERDLQRIRNIINKKYDEKITTSVGYSKKEEQHKEGDIWEEGGKEWILTNGIKRNVRKVDITPFPLLCPKCSKPMKHHIDKQMYGIHQMCLRCVVEMETELKMEGKFEEYEERMIKNNIHYTVENLSAGIDQFMDDIINETYVMEDGTIQRWEGNGLDVEIIKQQIKNKIQKLKDTNPI